MTTAHLSIDLAGPGRFVLLPSGRAVEVIRHDGDQAECRYLGTGDFADLRIDWLRAHGRPYAINPRGGR